MDQLTYEQLERVGQINKIIADMIDNYLPGNYRFVQRNPEESFEYGLLALCFSVSSVPELATVGQRMHELMTALHDTDRVFNEYSGDKAPLHKQLDLLRAALGNMDDACVALLMREGA
jgi:hypothetical protein